MPDSEHITLVASTVATVTLDADYSFVEVVNVTGSAAIYFTVDGTTPTVEGAGTHVLPATIGGLELTPAGSAAIVVKMISAGTPKVSVRGW